MQVLTIFLRFTFSILLLNALRLPGVSGIPVPASSDSRKPLSSTSGDITPPSIITTTNLPYNFTLTAVNITLPNANSTGVPLVLGQDGATSGLTFHVTSTYFSYPYNDYPSLSLIDGSLRAYLTSGDWITNSTGISAWDGTLSWVTSTLYREDAPKIFSAVWRAPESASGSGVESGISDGDGDDIGIGGISAGSGTYIGAGGEIEAGGDGVPGSFPDQLAELGIDMSQNSDDEEGPIIDGWWLCHSPNGGRLTQTNVVFNLTAVSDDEGGNTWASESGCYRVRIQILPLT